MPTTEQLREYFSANASHSDSNHSSHTAHGNSASEATSNDHTTDPPHLDESRRPLAQPQLRVVAENDEHFHDAPQHNTAPLDTTSAPTTTSPPHEADPSLETAAPPSPADEEDIAYMTPPLEQMLATTPLLPLTALLLSQQEDAPPPPTGTDDELLVPNILQESSGARAQERTVHFDITEDEANATSTEPVILHPGPTSVDDIRNDGPPASVKANLPHLRVRGIANSSGTFPTNTLYLAQVNPDAIVNPADYFRQFGESLPAMQAANLHIQERIQEVRAHPPTMKQDVTIVPGGRGV